MTLRILLVGLVASMGFELPGGAEVSTWAKSGCDWVHARLADLSGPALEADRPGAVPADCRQADLSDANVKPGIAEEAAALADAAFLAASEEMAAGFVADPMSMRDAAPPREEVASMPPGDSPQVGLPDGEELAAFAGSDEVGEATVEMEESPTRAERVSYAIRLTREAVHAWSELMHESPDEEGPAR